MGADIRIPSPGTFSPDLPGGGGGWLIGLLGVLIIGGMIIDGLSRSGRGEPGRRNYLVSAGLCSPTLESFDEFDRQVKQAYDRGLPDTVETGRRIASGIGSAVLSPGTVVTIVEQRRHKGASYNLVSLENSPQPCWLGTNHLKMGWIEWVSWNWSSRKAAAAREAQVATFRNAWKARWQEVPTNIVACQTGTLSVDYSGLGYENATPVDLTRCFKSGGSVSIKGAPGGFIYFPDGTGTDSTEFISPNRSQMLFAGPAGTQLTAECRCDKGQESPSARPPEAVGVCGQEPIWNAAVSYITKAREFASDAPEKNQYESSEDFDRRRAEWNTEYLGRLNGAAEEIGPVEMTLRVKEQSYNADKELLSVASERIPVPMVGRVPALSCAAEPVFRCDYSLLRIDSWIGTRNGASFAVPLRLAEESDVAKAPLSLRATFRFGVVELIGGGRPRYAPGLTLTQVSVVTERTGETLDAAPVYGGALGRARPASLPPPTVERLASNAVFELAQIRNFSNVDAARRCY